jgi:CRP-like cAMP-binding protein
MVATDLLRQFSFFDGLTSEQLQAVAVVTGEIRQGAGEALFYEHGPADALYLVIEGEVALFHSRDSAGNTRPRRLEALYQMVAHGTAIPLLEGQDAIYTEYLVGRVGAGEIVGISALLAPHVMTATARTQVPSRLLRLDAAALRARADGDAALGCALMRAAGQVAMARLHFARTRLGA